jgi:8-oxo-dGTP diphosphatase
MGKRTQMVAISVHLVLVRRNRVLLLRRFNTGWMDGKYSTVAGRVDENEPIRAAMSREAKEEAGIKINIGDLEFVHVIHRSSRDQRKKAYRQWIDLFFKAKRWSGVPRNMEPNKCDDMRWFSLDKLPEPMVPYVKRAIGRVKDGAFYSEFGWHA